MKSTTKNLKAALQFVNNQKLQVSRVYMNKADYDDIKKWGEPCKLCGMPGVQHDDSRECEIANVIDI